jgi:NAD(P)-dependent dehydrogenase (short-subunit alcohol dehydrogenase family)
LRYSNPNPTTGAIPKTDPSPLGAVTARRFEKKTVIVTGAASGIGLAAATRFAQEGARVVIADLHLSLAQKAAGLVKKAGAEDSLALICDVSNEEQVSACVREAMRHFGGLDVVVNNAGLMNFKPIAQLTGDDWLKVLGVDLLGTFYFIREAFLVMKPGGSIVNVSSIHAVETSPLVAPYAAAKAAVLSLTRSAAIEGSPLGIRVNAVLPGAVNTPMLWENPNVKSGTETVDRTMVGEPEDLAAAVAFLASSEARFVQGAMLVVDGGRIDHL